MNQTFVKFEIFNFDIFYMCFLMIISNNQKSTKIQ